MTLIQAQQKYIDRVNSCNTGHIHRVRGAAYRELYRYAEARGLVAMLVCKDAKDMAELALNSED